MSADEIKALAQQAFVDGMACHRAGLLDMEVRCKQYANALLDYAEMVERCEAEIAKLPYPPNSDDVYRFNKLNYILKGVTDGTKH